jgi:hypothetical protein
MSISTEAETPRERMRREHLEILEYTNELPTLAEVHSIGRALYDLFEKIEGRASSLEWLNEYGGDDAKYTELGTQCVDRGRALRLVLESALCGPLSGPDLQVGQRLARQLAELLVSGIDDLDRYLRRAELEDEPLTLSLGPDSD